MYCIEKASPDRLYRAALLRNHFADTILKAREKHLKRLATSYGRRKAEAEVAVAATDDNEDGRDGGELWTTMACPDALLAFPDAHLRRWENLGLGNTPYFPREAFPDALLMASEKPRPFPIDALLAFPDAHLRRRENLGLGNTPYFPREAFSDALLMASGKPRPFPTLYLSFPTHTYGVGKTYVLGIPLISHVRLVPTHYLRHWEYPFFPNVLCPTHELFVGKISYSRRLTLCVEKALIPDILLYASRITFSPDVLLYASGKPLIPDIFYADVFFDVGKSPISCSDRLSFST
ncbi:global transcription factor [Cucumis melo var. makuwa]|uniref:Global transcription factor n=1 Tax=Cucumis melo var. makuwa TaxID=1194695 RepID=A0A5A7TP57_CUCMM|nr:global transcription factor [Cucumis melo var. makuwa]